MTERPKMNQRFSELKKQAHEYAVDQEWYIDSFEQKFAELIVRECVGITDDLVNRNVDGSWTSNELYTDYNGALFEVKRRIEEHFGVEG